MSDPESDVDIEPAHTHQQHPQQPQNCNYSTFKVNCITLKESTWAFQIILMKEITEFYVFLPFFLSYSLKKI